MCLDEPNAFWLPPERPGNIMRLIFGGRSHCMNWRNLFQLIHYKFIQQSIPPTAYIAELGLECTSRHGSRVFEHFNDLSTGQVVPKFYLWGLVSHLATSWKGYTCSIMYIFTKLKMRWSSGWVANTNVWASWKIYLSRTTINVLPCILLHDDRPERATFGCSNCVNPKQVLLRRCYATTSMTVRMPLW